MSIRTATRGAALAVLALFAQACSISMRLPKDFLRLEHRGDLQAVTGDDARIWAREFEDENEAPLPFWAAAVEHDLVQQRGYELIAKGDIEGKRGTGGVWLECAANVRGERIGYLLALWVRGHEVRVVEFTARAEVFAARVDEVKQALPTVRW
jgi:hypothetical protein